MRVLMAFAVLGLLAAADASAQPLAAPHKDPFGRLFTLDSAPAIAAPHLSPIPQLFPSPSVQPKSTVVCGMTLWPVDPAIDPKIQVKPPFSNRKPMIKTIAPACQ